MKNWRLRGTLPAANVVIAMTALIVFYVRDTGHFRYEWYAPERMFCLAVNAPAITIVDALAALIRAVGRVLDLGPQFDAFPCNGAGEAVKMGCFLLLVWTQWYVVARGLTRGEVRQINSGGRPNVLGTARDVCLICFGLAVAMDGLTTYADLDGAWHVKSSYPACVAAFYFAWAAVIVICYGRALLLRVASVRAAKR
jgi:hypothetical protein